MALEEMVVMVEVESEDLKAIGWIANSLFVTFKKGDRTYRYDGVPRGIYDLLWGADVANKALTTKSASGNVVMEQFKQSVGSLFHYLILLHKEKFPATKVTLPK